MRSSILAKLTAAALAALMLLPLASCATQTDTQETGANTSASTTPVSSSDSTVETEIETDNTNYECDLPEDLDFKDEEVTIMYVKVAGREDELVDLGELGHGVISDAVYERNIAVENQLHIKFAYDEQASDTAAQAKITTLVNGGDRSVDLFTLGTYCAVTPAVSGCYLNLNNVEYVDLSKHYWSQDYNDVFTFTSSDKNFVATSPAAISLFRLTYLTIFNRDLFENYKIPDLYDTVKSGEWTLDYQFKITSDIWLDKDSDGKSSEKDFFGFITGTCISVDAYCVASDIHMVVRDETGYMAYNKEDNERIVEMAGKVSDLYNAKGTYRFIDATYDDIGKHYIIEKFANEEGLMATTQFFGLEKNINALSGFNYGIVPMPKLDTLQEKYMTYVQDQVSAFGISAAINSEKQIEMLGAVMEAMAYHSNEIVRPAYYDSTLSLRFMQDPESRSILDTMFETISFDYCYATGFGDLRGELRTRLPSSDPAISSRLKSWEMGMTRKLDRENAALDKLS